MAASLILIFIMLAAPVIGQTPQPGDNISGTGTVEFFDVEGGFYGISSDDGAHYLPLNLDPELMVNGTRVFFNVTVSDQQASIIMWGTAVEVNSIEELPGMGDTGSMTGTVHYIPEYDGYGIITDSGLYFLPASIPEEFRANGTRIQFDYEVTYIGSGALWATGVTITNAELAPENCDSCNFNLWTYSPIIIILAAFILFKISRRRRGAADDGIDRPGEDNIDGQQIEKRK